MKILSFPRRKISHEKFEELIRPQLEQMYRMAYRFCGNQDDAEDLVQDVLAKLYSRRAEVGEIEKLKPWISKVLYRQFVDQYRQKSRSPIQLFDEITATDDATPSDCDPPDKMLEQEREIQRVERALLTLSDEHRIVISLHDVEGYPLNEIVELLEIPMGTLKSRLHRARARLKEILNYQ